MIVLTCFESHYSFFDKPWRVTKHAVIEKIKIRHILAFYRTRGSVNLRKNLQKHL
jgi:hypothetical protein